MLTGVYRSGFLAYGEEDGTFTGVYRCLQVFTGVYRYLQVFTGCVRAFGTVSNYGRR